MIGNVFSTESGRGQKTIMKVPLLLVRAEWSQVAKVQPPQGVFQVPTERGKGLNSTMSMGSEGPRQLMVARHFI